MMISILIPCYNEEKYIEDCLTSVLAFMVPDGQEIEILVIDGRSSDGTLGIIERFTRRDPRVRLVDNPKRIQSCALNIGIRLFRGDWFMRLDAHTHYPVNYLEQCHETARANEADNVGGVCITYPGGDTYQAQIVQALTTHKFGVGNSGFRTGTLAGYRDTVPFGFFRRGVFDRIGFFDERLVRGQDYEFNRRIKAASGQIYLNPDIQSSYFNLASFVDFLRKQLYRQGPFNAYMWYLAPYAFTPRHAITGCFALFFWIGFAGALFSSLCALVFFSVAAGYVFLAIIASVQQARRYKLPLHIICLPICFLLFHLCHGTGVLVGLAKLAVGAAPVQQSREPWPGAGKFRAWP